MDPRLMLWKGIWLESPNGCELGVSDGVFLGTFQLEPDSEMWKYFCRKFQMVPSLMMGTNFWLEILNVSQLGDFEGNFGWKL